MNKLSLGSALASVLALTACATTATAPASSSLSDQDLSFLTSAYQLINFDLAECAVIQKVGASASVERVAQQVCADAQHYQPLVAQQAASHGVTLPNTLPYHLKAELVQLTYNPADINAAYLRSQISSHEDSLAIFRDEAANGVDPSLKQTAIDTIPVVQANLDRLRGAMPPGMSY
jgi:putative membrane protein